MKQVFAPHELAIELMDNLFDLYACAVLTTDADLEDETFEKIASEEARKYARRKFLEICEEFEKNIPDFTWCWVCEENEEPPLTSD